MALVIDGVEYWKVALVTLVIISIDTVVAIVAKNLGTVLGITGAIGSSTIMLILPSIMYLRYLVKAKKTWRTLFIIPVAIPQFVSLLLIFVA